MADENPIYAKINRKVWNTRQFRALSRDAKELFFYLTTCPHGNMLGIFVLRPGYVLDDLQWGIDRERFRKSLGELLDQHLFKYDPENEIILDMEQILKHPPINENVAKAGTKLINNLPNTILFHDLKLLAESLGKSFMKSFIESLGERFGKSVTVTVTEAVTEAEGGVGETEPEKHLPVDNSEPKPPLPEDDPPPTDLPEEDQKRAPLEKPEEKPKSQNTHGERWTKQQGGKLEELMEYISGKYGVQYHQLVYVWVQVNYNSKNPEAMIHCLGRLISDLRAGHKIPLPGRWLDALLNGNADHPGENGKFEAAESGRECERHKGEFTKLEDLIPPEIRARASP